MKVGHDANSRYSFFEQSRHPLKKKKKKADSFYTELLLCCERSFCAEPVSRLDNAAAGEIDVRADLSAVSMASLTHHTSILNIKQAAVSE